MNLKLNPTQIDILRELSRTARKELLREVFLLFLNDGPQKILKIHDALVRQDYKSASRDAHSFKTSCANIGADTLVALCAEIELRPNLALGEGLKKAFDSVREEILTMPEITGDTP